MNIGIISLMVLIVAIFIGFKFGINTGLVSIAFAYLLGFFVFINVGPADTPKMVAMSSISAKGTAIVSGWNIQLFFTLVGMMLLFSAARVNGTLELLARKTSRISKGNRRLLPVIFFLMSTLLAFIGPGNIAVCALVLPIAIAVSQEEDISLPLMSTMVIAGANAGGLSPFAPTGLIGNELAAKQDIEIGRFDVCIQMIIAQIIIAAVLYTIFGGWKLKKDKSLQKPVPEAFNQKQRLTLATIMAVVLVIIVFKISSTALIGLIAFLGGVVLLAMDAADEKTSIAAIPWSTLILVCGVGVLVNVVDKAGGIEVLTQVLLKFMNERTAAPLMTIVGGLMSAVSSASGVVMPTLIPTVPGIVTQMDGSIPAQTLVMAIILGAHVVTNSPLSTLGALAIANTPEEHTAGTFKTLLAVGFGGILLGAALVFLHIVG